MEFAHDQFDYLEAEEYAQLYTRYTPLAAAVRDLMHASLRAELDAETMQAATTAIGEVTGLLLGAQRSRSPVQLRHSETGRAVVWHNPVTGPRNPLAPPLMIHHEPDGSCWSEFTLRDVYEGPPGWVHGGVCAMVLDQVLGEVATKGMTRPRFTGSITVRYLRPTPLGRLRAEASIYREEDRKSYVRGFIADDQGPTAQAEGVFITPAWALVS